MAYSIGQVKSDLIAVLHGTTLDQIQSINALLERAGRKLLNDMDPIETERIVELATPLYDRVFDYPCPSDLKDDRILDIYPQVKRKLRDRFFQQYAEEFDLYKSFNVGKGEFTVEWNTYQKFLRISKDLPQPILINPATTITGSGTWVTGGNATDLAQDNLNYIYGNSSLMFNLSGGINPSSGYLENSTFQAEDLTREDDQGVLFAYVYIPTPSDIVSFNLRWGSSSSDYFDNTVTANFFGNSFETGWNLLKFDWISATETGTVDSSQTSYLRFTVNYNGTAQNGVHLNNITSQLGTIYMLKYYSKFLFRDSITGAFKETISNDADYINLDITSYNIYINACAYFAMQQQKSNNGQYDAAYFLNEYKTEKDRYVRKLRSQTIKPQSAYYKMPPKRSSTARRFNS